MQLYFLAIEHVLFRKLTSKNIGLMYRSLTHDQQLSHMMTTTAINYVDPRRNCLIAGRRYCPEDVVTVAVGMMLTASEGRELCAANKRIIVSQYLIPINRPYRMY